MPETTSFYDALVLMGAFGSGHRGLPSLVLCRKPAPKIKNRIARTSEAGLQKKERVLLKSECLINVMLPPSHHDEDSDANAGME